MIVSFCRQEVQALHEAVATEKASIKALASKHAGATKQTEVLPGIRAYWAHQASGGLLKGWNWERLER